MSSPTQRSKALLLELGYEVEVVERWVPGANIRRDAFNIGDLLACHPAGQLLLVQTTTRSNMAARVAKLVGNRAALTWLKAGGEIHFHGWSKTGPRGKRKTWTCAVAIALADPGPDGFRLHGLPQAVQNPSPQPDGQPPEAHLL